ncbi:dipeptide ABC transporter ATP-binding protein [Nonomuraea phyllanthi]|uniref:dipeptide ABC transporter ATP-binding protein n=1 Tax=Nonomuraea phyllanthi TaxID=2219224 RepID=UPI0012933CBA|nr:ABC transporter ATP-binding protein [Nonomuraea phyllanthi]QFY09871.1 dipeptide ABC transporter ATP-binding protein [Nonomuraea phyllanthi]
MTVSTVNPTGTAVEVSDLRVAYGGDEVVHGVSFRLRRGARLGIVGESGSGKSTVARAVLGLLPPGGHVTGGRIELLDTDVVGRTDKEMNDLRGRVVSLVFQDPLTSLDPVKPIGKQIAEVIVQHHRGLPRAEVRERCLRLLNEVGVNDAERRLKQYPHEFSGGMRQRVLIAIAIANQPDVLIADEPTTALDVTTQAQVLDLLRTTAERHGMSVILVTHDLGVVAEFCDEVVVMKAGEIIETGTAEQIFASPAQDYTRHLLDCIPRPGDRRPGPEFGDPGDAEPAAVLTITGLRKRYGRGPHVLDDIDLTLHAGETVGIVGESGAGKSTLARTLIRLENASGGTIDLNGADFGAARSKRLRELRRDIQMVFQDPFSSLDPHMQVVDIVAQPLIVHGLCDRPAARARATEMLASMGLDEQFLDRLPRNLSGGQRQRVAIARALILRPAVAVLDEPISALDVSVRAQVLDLLREEQLSLGTAYLFIVHDLAVARYFCDRIAVLYEGKIVEFGSPAELFERPRHPYTRRLLDAIPDPHHLQRRMKDTT